MRLFVRAPGDERLASETSVPASTLSTLSVSPRLARWSSPILAYRETFAPGQQVTERVVPDGSARLIVHLGAGGPKALIAGASTAPVLLTMAGAQHGLSMALNPGAIAALFGGMNASELADRAVSLEALWPDAHELAFRLVDARDDGERARIVSDVFESKLGDAPSGHRTAARAATLLQRAGGRRSITSIADELGVGERRLQQLFQTHIGLGPRRWARLCRLHACLRLLRAPHAGWASVATEVGYYDQSHLVNEVRALSGLTPTELLALVSGSSKPDAHGPR